MAEPEKITALIRSTAAPASALAVYEPQTFDEAMRIALVYASSGLLGEVRSQEAALVIMATGAELGIPATTALRAIHIVKGKPILSSDLIVALCLKKTDICEYFMCTESTSTSATFETKRKGVPVSAKNTFTIEDARRAKLGLEWDKQHGKLVESSDSNWAKYPKAMLRHRAAAELARQVYPDIVLGLYTVADEDEIASDVIDVAPVVAQLVTEPVRTREPEEVPLGVAMQKWTAALFTAANKEECEEVRREAKERISKGMPEWNVIAKAYSDRIKELANAPAAKVAEADVIDKVKGAFGADVETRTPGEEG